MRQDIRKSVLEIGVYVAKTGATVRETAKVFGLSKSTVHSYLAYKLRYLDVELYERVQKRLGYNLAVRHIRGGEATRRKYREVQATR